MLRNLAMIIPSTSIVYRSDCIGSDLSHVSQDVANRSFTAPAPVAVHSEHTSDKAPFLSHAGDLGTTLGGTVTAGCTLV